MNELSCCDSSHSFIRFDLQKIGL